MMAFGDFLGHTCEITHIRREDSSPGYNLPASPVFSYPETPDLAGVPCHFHVVRRRFTGGSNIRQGRPFATYEGKVKLSLPAGVDVRLNDRVVDCATGHRYIAENPRDVRGHHVVAMLRRPAGEEML